MKKAVLFIIFAVLYCLIDNSAGQYGNAKERCPKGWRRFGCSCYYFSKRTVTWYVGDAMCRRRGGYLAEMNTESELNWVQAALRARAKYFPDDHNIGGSNLAGDVDEWFWNTNFEPICLRNQPECKGVQDWGATQPSLLLTGRCLELDINDNWKYHDGRCFEPDYFICERNIKNCHAQNPQYP